MNPVATQLVSGILTDTEFCKWVILWVLGFVCHWHDNVGCAVAAAYKAAQRNFIESMAAYAVVCYLLQVRIWEAPLKRLGTNQYEYFMVYIPV